MAASLMRGFSKIFGTLLLSKFVNNVVKSTPSNLFDRYSLIACFRSGGTSRRTLLTSLILYLEHESMKLVY